MASVGYSFYLGGGGLRRAARRTGLQPRDPTAPDMDALLRVSTCSRARCWRLPLVPGRLFGLTGDLRPHGHPDGAHPEGPQFGARSDFRGDPHSAAFSFGSPAGTAGGLPAGAAVGVGASSCFRVPAVATVFLPAACARLLGVARLCFCAVAAVGRWVEGCALATAG